MNQDPQRILVVGGAGAIGGAIAKFANDRGHRVVVTSSKPIESAGSIVSVQMDVRSDDSVKAAIRQCAERLEGPTAVIYVPALSIDKLIHTSAISDWQQVYDVNLFGAVRVVREIIPHFLKKRGGTFQFISSTAATRGSVGASAYASSKAALNSLAQAVSLEYGRFNVRAYSLMPGFVNGGLLAAMEPEKKQLISKSIALKRFAEVDEVARFSILTLEAGAYLTGTAIAFDGGSVSV